jgi:hypothetical protein
MSDVSKVSKVRGGRVGEAEGGGGAADYRWSPVSHSGCPCQSRCPRWQCHHCPPIVSE